MSVDEVLSMYPKAVKIEGKKHLIGTFVSRKKKYGVFVVGTDSRVLDRAAYREIAEEAKSEVIDGTFHIYGKICTYSGPGFYFENLGGS